MKDLDLFQKYGFLTDGFARQYVSHVKERKYDFENTTPNKLQILVPEVWDNPSSYGVNSALHTFETSSWLRLIETLFNYLQSKSPKSREELLEFRTDWSKALIFADYKAFNNMVQVGELYMSVNFTATHSAWFIGDLLNFYGINTGYIFVHRSPIAEPNEILERVLNERKEGFKKYLIFKCGKSVESADKIIAAFDNSFNKILQKMSSSYYNYFLLDSTMYLSNLKSKMLIDINKYVVWSDSKKEVARRYLDYYSNYCTTLMKEAKKHKEDLEFIIPVA